MPQSRHVIVGGFQCRIEPNKVLYPAHDGAGAGLPTPTAPPSVALSGARLQIFQVACSRQETLTRSYALSSVFSEGPIIHLSRVEQVSNYHDFLS